MKNDEVTEYRAHWDGAEARFRLFGFVFDGSQYRLEITDYWDCDVTDVIDDADYYFTDQGALWSLATVDTASAGATLTWLHGYDYRIAASSYTQWRARTDMQLRYLAARSQHSQPVVLPDGLRLIRMFPSGWAAPYGKRSPTTIPRSRKISAWNRHWLMIFAHGTTPGQARASTPRTGGPKASPCISESKTR